MMSEIHPDASSSLTKNKFRQKIHDSWLEEEGHAEALIDMQVPSNDEKEEDGKSPDSFSDSAWEKQRERRAVVAGVAGGFAGLVLLGPIMGVTAGVAGALISKRMNQKKEALTSETARNETELATLLSPKPQI